MRVTAYVTRWVGVVVECVDDEAEAVGYDHQATGFFVTLPSEALPGMKYGIFVTAKHVASALKDRPVGFIVNRRDGGVTTLESVGDNWFTHPSDESVDVAVMPFGLKIGLDILSLT